MRILILTLCFFPLIVFSQNSRLKLADKMYENCAYFEASNMYNDVLERGVDSSKVSTKIADCYYKMGDALKSYKWYQFKELKSDLSQDELIKYNLVSRQVGDYSKSLELAKAYSKKYGNTSFVNKILNDDANLKYSSISPNFELLEQKFVNSSSSEIGVSYLNDSTVLLSSNKRNNSSINRIHSWNGDYFYSIYSASVDDNQISKKVASVSDLNTKFHDGPCSYDKISGWIYFTRDNYYKKKKGFDAQKKMKLKIYRGNLVNGKIENIEELPFNSNDFSCGHPSISEDGKVLYFSSDMPGGFGGSDLYKVEIKNDNSFGKPINLGKSVNTELDELFPYYNSKDAVLFFSSKGHLGFGGLDVFYSLMNSNSNFDDAQNLGQPINSRFDDFSFINSSDQTDGFFASNRDGGKGNDDIYSFHQFKPYIKNVKLEGILTDISTNKVVKDTWVFLKDNGQIIDSIKTNNEGGYNFSIPANKTELSLNSIKENYSDGFKTFSIDKDVTVIKEDVNISPDLNYFLKGIVKDKESNKDLENVKVTIIEKESGKVIDILETKKDGFNSNALVEKVFGDIVNYDFRLEKQGYVTETKDFSKKLDFESIINVNAIIDLKLTKVKIGETDLSSIIKINPIYFDYNKYDIRPDAAFELDKIVKVMKENPTMVIELGSHTDSRGNNDYNIILSDNRAKASANYIISKGIDKSRIYGKGYGETKLKISDKVINTKKSVEEKEVLHQNNRRTEFIIVKM